MDELIKELFKQHGVAAIVISLLVGIVLWFSKKYIQQIEGSIKDISDNQQRSKTDHETLNKKLSEITDEFKKHSNDSQLNVGRDLLSLREELLKIAKDMEVLQTQNKFSEERLSKVAEDMLDIVKKLEKHDAAIAATSKLIKHQLATLARNNKDQ